MVSKFEAVGIGISIGAMALALFLLRVDSSIISSGTQLGTEQVASVVVNNSDSRVQDRREAYTEATNETGSFTRLVIEDVLVGEGEMVEEGNTVSVHYIGTLQNGQEFDNSLKRGTPFKFTVGEGKVMKGWEEGILGMQVGGLRTLVVTYHLA